MKVLQIEINGKTYYTMKLTAYLSKEALKLQKDALVLAKLGKKIQENPEDMDMVETLLEELESIKNRKICLICDIYGDKFSSDDLEKSLSDEEIDAQVNGIISGIVGVIQKN